MSFFHFHLPLLQFNRYEPNEEGRITERQFAKMILSYADFTHQEKKKYLKRLKVAFQQEDLVSAKCWSERLLHINVGPCSFNDLFYTHATYSMFERYSMILHYCSV